MYLKKIVFTFLLFPFALLASPIVNGEGDTTIVFSETMHDFGTIEKGQTITYKFVFKNEGKEDLILLDVRSTCHNLHIDWPKEEIKKGQTGEIRISFKAVEITTFTKKIIVYSTATPSPEVLIIKGHIINKK